ncbi:MAG: class IV adenylate cyclase [Chitinophagaceae bacterium]|jgi:predicted adenylyl cyclase CyaB|nr:class IV adenylate cyclase [Chitinophagaceae bacterium]OQY93623.1 MAG: adenylate cyclase [Sphingobacteriales bacterium UTBCD1]
MPYINVEIKARCPHASFIRNYLLQHHADFKGTDQQTDTYFNVKSGRLKLREGIIENNLIYYHRKDQAGPKESDFSIAKVTDPFALKEILEQLLGIRIIVQKKREIYYIGNVKFHIDEVPELGSFVEIEAGNMLNDLTKQQLQEQCNFYLNEFRIRQIDLVAESYCDLILKKPDLNG